MDNKVEKFYVGDQVFGSTGPRFGACAEYIALPASYPTIHKPRNVPHFTATTIPVIEVHALLFCGLPNLRHAKKS
jgi:NADPH:quinone reductase-like Zn-dependent oxidoreductase